MKSKNGSKIKRIVRQQKGNKKEDRSKDVTKRDKNSSDCFPLLVGSKPGQICWFIPPIVFELHFTANPVAQMCVLCKIILGSDLKKLVLFFSSKPMLSIDWLFSDYIFLYLYIFIFKFSLENVPVKI